MKRFFTIYLPIFMALAAAVIGMYMPPNALAKYSVTTPAQSFYVVAKDADNTTPILLNESDVQMNVAVTSASDNVATLFDNDPSIVEGNNDRRWTNWQDCQDGQTEAARTAAITFTWDVPLQVSSITVYFFTDQTSASLPASVSFTLNGTVYTESDFADKLTTVSNGDTNPNNGSTITVNSGFTLYSYTYTFPTDVGTSQSLDLTVTAQVGHYGGNDTKHYMCVGITEVFISVT